MVRLPQSRRNFSASDQFRDPREVLVHYAVFVHGRAYRPDGRMRPCPRFEVFSGARKSSAWAAAMASIAIALRVFSTISFSFSAAVIPMET